MAIRIVSADQARQVPYPYIYINEDGSARELHASERSFLETPFHPADGDRPYIKWRYSQKNGWGEIAGYLRRWKLFGRTQVQPAPIEDPIRPLTKQDQIQFMRDKGMEVVENSDGSFTAKKPDRWLS